MQGACFLLLVFDRVRRKKFSLHNIFILLYIIYLSAVIGTCLTVLKHTWLIYWPTCFNVEKSVHFFWRCNFLVSLVVITNTAPFPYTEKAICSVMNMKCFVWSRNWDFHTILIKFLFQSVIFVWLLLCETLLCFRVI